MSAEKIRLGRRNFLQMTSAGLVAAAGAAKAAQASDSDRPADSETAAVIVRQPSPEFAPEMTTADIIVDTLIAWGATHCFGVVGDGINSIIEALRKRQDQIQYVGARHEEARPSWRRASPNIPGGLASASARPVPARSTS